MAIHDWYKFQFQYGAIISISTIPTIVVTQLFQFQYGVIISTCFATISTDYNKFQFQYGAIISKKRSKSIITLCLFQFQYGAIIRNWKGKDTSHFESFNSNMVRL